MRALIHSCNFDGFRSLYKIPAAKGNSRLIGRPKRFCFRYKESALCQNCGSLKVILLLMEQALERKFIETGEQQRLKELVRRRLEESGWHDDIRKYLREIIRKRGFENVNTDDLIKEVTPKARQSVPETVKKELLNQIEAFIQHETGVNLTD